MELEQRSTRTIEMIREIVSEICGVSLNDLHRRSGTRKSVEARQIMMYMLRKFMHMSYKEILRHFDARNHTTVMYSLQTIEGISSYDKRVAKLMSMIESDIDKAIRKKEAQLKLSYFTIFDGVSARGMYNTEQSAMMNLEPGEKILSIYT